MRMIEYQDETGAWRVEIAPGDDRPAVEVEDWRRPMAEALPLATIGYGAATQART